MGIINFVTATVFILLFSTTLVRSSKCPSMCKCDTFSVSCVEKSIAYIPNFDVLENSPSVIDLSGNDITEVQRNDFNFEVNKYVIEVYLNNSNLADIHPEAFAEMKKLQGLYLQTNLLSSVPEGFIKRNRDLILLNLAENLFNDMPKITSKSLEILILSKSDVHVVPADSLDNLPNIRLLMLDQNKITHIAVSMFQSAKSFFYVELRYNPWDCNCQTIHLFEYLTNERFIDPDEPAMCLTTEKKFMKINGVIEMYKKKCADDAGLLFTDSLVKVQKEVKGDLKQSPLMTVEEGSPRVTDLATNQNTTTVCVLNYRRSGEIAIVATVTTIVVFVSFTIGYFFGKRQNMYMMGSTDSKFKLIYPNL